MKLYREKQEKQVSGLAKIHNILKKRKTKIVLGVGAVLICTSFLVNQFSPTAKMERLNDSVEIIQEYTNENDSAQIRDYIELSKELNKFLKRNKFVSMTYSIEKEVETATLLSPDVIRQMINNLKNNQINVIEGMKTLMIQEMLVNMYLYNSYDTVNSILDGALREYIGKKFDISDIENVRYSFYVGTNEYYCDVSYRGTEIDKGLDRKIRSAIIDLNNLTTENDPDISDNNLYNSERNELLAEALEQAADLYKSSEDVKMPNIK